MDSISSLGHRLSVIRIAAYAAVFTAIQLPYHLVSNVALTAESVVVTVIGGMLGAWLLGVLLWNLPLRSSRRLALVWSSLFIVQMFADLIEGAFFTTRISTLSIFLGGTLVSVVVTFFESLVAVLLFPSSFAPLSLRSLLGAYFMGRSRGSWLARFVVGSVAYFPVYFLFGALVSPFVIPYYTNPSLGLGLTIPSFSVLISVELLRGILFVFALVPVIAAVRLSRRSTFFLVASFLYVLGAYVPFVAGTTLPWTLKFIHSIEISADSVVYGSILTYLFKLGH